MNLIPRFRTSIGSKLVMAVTGVALLLFVIVHLVGNLLVFAGQTAMNNYAAWLQSLGGLLWVARGGLLLLIGLHIANAILLSRDNAAARPVRYAYEATVGADLASRTMLRTGVVVALYLVYHLLHFTLGVTNPEHSALRDAGGRHDVFGMVVAGFRNPLIALVYVLANLVLAVHLSHGIRSALQTFGLNHPQYNPLIRRGGPLLAWLIFAGFASIPLAILFGIVVPPEQP